MRVKMTFKGELAQLLTRPNDAGVINYVLNRRASIKDVVESLGVPHTEIYFVAAGNGPATLEQLAEPGQSLTLSPAAPPVDVTQPTPLRPEPLPKLRFVVDENVGRLAGLLRMLGFDAVYDRLWDDERIAEMAQDEKRVVLTRDRALLKRSQVVYGRLVRAPRPWDQLAEVVSFFGVESAPALFKRCIRCNGILEPVDKKDILDRLEPKTKKYFNEFNRCPDCGRIYWRGSHFEKMIRFMKNLKIPGSLANRDAKV